MLCVCTTAEACSSNSCLEAHGIEVSAALPAKVCELFTLARVI
jgi:hypothetical protein